MASCQTEQWVKTSPYVLLTVTEAYSDGGNATLSWKLEYIAKSAASSSVDKPYTVIIGGETVADGKFSINGKTGTHTIASGRKTISKATSEQTVSFSVSFTFNLTWSGVRGGTKSASSSISISAKTSYTISYNANGGSNAPSSQTKWHGTAVQLSSAKPTKAGHTFLNWLSSAQNQAYDPGDLYGHEESTTMVAQWKANTYIVAYDANGGSGAPGNQIKTYGQALTLSSTKPTRANYNFKGWGVAPSSTTVSYAAGASYTTNASITLYAIWELAYTKPRITSLSVSRCDEGGNADDEGTCALVEFHWACDRSVLEILIEWESANDAGSHPITASGTSGNVSQIIGNGAISADATYSILVHISDNLGISTESATLNGTKFSIDFLAGGTGVAFGKPAEKENAVEFALKMFDSFGMAIGNGLTEYTGAGDSSIDADTTLEHLVLSNKNTPTTSFWYVLTFFYSGKSQGGNRAQIAIPYKTNDMLHRRYKIGDTWSEWRSNLDDIYPIGSCYISFSSDNPKNLFGGTWQRVEGRFLYGCASSGTIGATGSHTTGQGSSTLPYVNVAIWKRTA